VEDWVFGENAKRIFLRECVGRKGRVASEDRSDVKVEQCPRLISLMKTLGF
jgi:hypothetical protein